MLPPASVDRYESQMTERQLSQSIQRDLRLFGVIAHTRNPLRPYANPPRPYKEAQTLTSSFKPKSLDPWDQVGNLTTSTPRWPRPRSHTDPSENTDRSKAAANVRLILIHLYLSVSLLQLSPLSPFLPISFCLSLSACLSVSRYCAFSLCHAVFLPVCLSVWFLMLLQASVAAAAASAAAVPGKALYVPSHIAAAPAVAVCCVLSFQDAADDPLESWKLACEEFGGLRGPSRRPPQKPFPDYECQGELRGQEIWSQALEPFEALPEAEFFREETGRDMMRFSAADSRKILEDCMQFNEKIKPQNRKAWLPQERERWSRSKRLRMLLRKGLVSY